MRNIMIFAAFMVGLGTIMAQMADKMTPAQASTSARKAARGRDTGAERRSRGLSIPRDSRGPFPDRKAVIDGPAHRLHVDTALSVIALNETSAAAVSGCARSRNDYNATVTTANGTIKAARTRLRHGSNSGGLVGARLSRPWWLARRGAVGKTCSACPFLSKLKRFRIRQWQRLVAGAVTARAAALSDIA